MYLMTLLVSTCKNNEGKMCKLDIENLYFRNNRLFNYSQVLLSERSTWTSKILNIHGILNAIKNIIIDLQEKYTSKQKIVNL